MKRQKDIWLLLLGLLATLAGLGSCDSREDYFLLKCDEPEVRVNESQGDKIDTIGGQRYIGVDLSWGETKTIDFDFIDPYGLDVDDYYIELKGYGGGEDLHKFFNSNEDSKNPFNSDYIDFQIDKKNKKIIITDKTTDPLIHLRDGRIETMFHCNFYLYIKNELGKPGYATIYFTLKGNQPPAPIINIADGNKPMEKIISIDGNDPNDNEVVKYEYCIDGNVIGDRGYENEEYYNNPNIKKDFLAEPSGKAAYNGTYITATRISSINHVFQSKGEHIIYVRCKDTWGYWSDWVKKDIRISE